MKNSTLLSGGGENPPPPFSQFLEYTLHTSTDFEDIFTDHVTWVHIVKFGIYCSVLEWGGGEMGGLGRPYIKFKLFLFAIYSCVMEKGVFILFFIFHQFRINLLDMPHRIWRKISQIM